jgi:para-aminobenzoate synthetase
MKTLIIDNYDSYTFNLLSLWTHSHDEVVMVRNDALTTTELRDILVYFDNVLISPGPGRPGRVQAHLTLSAKPVGYGCVR